MLTHAQKNNQPCKNVVVDVDDDDDVHQPVRHEGQNQKKGKRSWRRKNTTHVSKPRKKHLPFLPPFHSIPLLTCLFTRPLACFLHILSPPPTHFSQQTNRQTDNSHPLPPPLSPHTELSNPPPPPPPPPPHSYPSDSLYSPLHSPVSSSPQSSSYHPRPPSPPPHPPCSNRRHAAYPHPPADSPNTSSSHPTPSHPPASSVTTSCGGPTSPSR